jgi:hypothetical protein
VQRSRTVRADLEVADLLALANGIALAGADTGQIKRLLDLIRRGADSKPLGEVLPSENGA